MEDAFFPFELSSKMCEEEYSRIEIWRFNAGELEARLCMKKNIQLKMILIHSTNLFQNFIFKWLSSYEIKDASTAKY